MYISKLSLVNYRNFANAKCVFNKGINTIIGENGSGKTNLFRAIRLLLDDNLLRAAYRLETSDFNRGLGNWRGHWIIISLEFDELSQDEAVQALFLHGAGNIGKGGIEKATYNLIFRPKHEIRYKLAQLKKGDSEGLAALIQTISMLDYETVFTGKSEADFNDPETYKLLVGDFDKVKFNKVMEPHAIGVKVPRQLSISKEVSLTFVKALRDVVSDFQDNRTNPLRVLLKSRSDCINEEEYEPITTMIKNLNGSIESLSDVQAVCKDIKDTIKGAVGETYSPSSLSIKSDLSDEADKVLQSLKLFVGESEEGYEGAIHELSLGGANLIYLTLKLLEFKYQKAKQSFANFLLIEEPEAHIHTHIQKTLFEKINYDDTQIIYSTHSTHISEVSNVGNMNIIGKVDGRCEVYQPSFNLTPKYVQNVQRYLDATRSNLLFAKGIILVEGDAEEILIPILVKKVMGVSLDELGISLVNIRSTGFENVAVLFHNDRIRRRCSIITDLDQSIIDTNPEVSDSKATAKKKLKCKNSELAGSARKKRLDGFVKDNDWVDVFFAKYTFEVDFVAANNPLEIQKTVKDVYSNQLVIKKSNEALDSEEVSEYGARVLKMADKVGKGWFAILVGNYVGHDTYIPKYIIDAISFAKPDISKEVWFDILKYSLVNLRKKYTTKDHNEFKVIADEIKKFRNGTQEMAEIKKIMIDAFPDDPIRGVLEGMVCSV